LEFGKNRRVAQSNKELYIKCAKRERDYKIAKGLKEDGISISIISKNTSLSIDEIDRIVTYSCQYDEKTIIQMIY